MPEQCLAECHAQWREEPYICDLPKGHDGDVHQTGPRCSWTNTPEGGGWVHIACSDLGVVKIDLS